MSFATADLCDEFGDEVRVAEPLLGDWGGAARFAGLVETLRVFEDNALVRDALEAPGRGRVLVVDGGGSLRTALVGGNLAALGHRNGWSGIVVLPLLRAELAPGGWALLLAGGVAYTAGVVFYQLRSVP